MNFWYQLLFTGVAVGVVFGILWKTGQVARLSAYMGETREELRKCTWPTWDELKGSTIVVAISVLGLGLCIVVADLIITLVISSINS